MRPRRLLAAPLTICSLFLLACSGETEPGTVLPITGPALASTGAGPPQQGSGTGLITSLEILSRRNAGPNEVQERRLSGTVEGTLNGTFVQHVRGVIHPNGQVTFQGTMEFTGTLAGCGSGTLLLGLTGKGETGLPVTEATVRPIKQAGNTLATNGVGTVRQVGPLLSYDLRYLCR
jgi:hypothetical protein